MATWSGFLMIRRNISRPLYLFLHARFETIHAGPDLISIFLRPSADHQDNLGFSFSCPDRITRTPNVVVASWWLSGTHHYVVESRSVLQRHTYQQIMGMRVTRIPSISICLTCSQAQRDFRRGKPLPMQRTRFLEHQTRCTETSM